jgi:hypothetical protein
MVNSRLQAWLLLQVEFDVASPLEGFDQPNVEKPAAVGHASNPNGDIAA